MDPKNELEILANFRNLYCTKNYFPLNNFKPLRYSVLKKEFKLSLGALIEKREFLKNLRSQIWPQGMLNRKDDQFCTTFLNAEIWMNRGIHQTVLRSLKSIFLCISSILVIECKVVLQTRLESTQPIRADKPLFPYIFQRKTQQVFGPPRPALVVRLISQDRARVELEVTYYS